MRMVIDARLYGPRHGGLGRYVQQLIQRLPGRAGNDEWLWLMGDQAAADYRQDIGQLPTNVKIIAAPWRWYTWAEQRHLPALLRRLRPDAIHYPHFNVPWFSPRPMVVTIHDLIIHHFPSSRATTLSPVMYAAKLAAYRAVVRRAVHGSRNIIVPTAFVKNDLISQYPTVDPQKIKVIYEGVTTWSGPVVALTKYGITGSFLLYVGSAYPHKDVLTALRAFKQLRAAGLVKQFVHVWRPDQFLSKLRQQAQQQSLSAGVIWPGFVPDQELPALYQAAAAYVFPSLYEGFGLPPLEAQAYGCPVVAARSSCLPEVLGQSAAWFEPGQPDQLVTAVQPLLTDAASRQNLINSGYQNASRFNWETMINQTLEIYQAGL